MGCENEERVSPSGVWWAGVPEVGSRAAEGSRAGVDNVFKEVEGHTTDPLKKL